MTTSNPESLIQEIHASGKQLVLSVTGGGSRAIGDLLSVPGASASVLEAIVPYSDRALAEWLGGAPDNACSEWTARAMAMAAFEQARKLSDGDVAEVRGIGATASLATTRPKRGAHRVHVAWQSVEQTVVVSCELVKGARSRDEEEDVARRLILAAVAEACAVDAEGRATTTAEEPIVRREKRAPAEWTELLLGQRQLCEIERPGTDRPKILFPGAFHPFHTAHAKMAEVAARRLGGPVTFELSIANVDKPPLDFVEIDERLQGLAGRPVWLTRAATFVEKSELAPGATFVVGADTIERIGEVRYYGDEVSQRDAAVAALAGWGCRFLVFGRQWNGKYCGLGDLRLPPGLAALCDEVPETEFRQDVSSTGIRSDD